MGHAGRHALVKPVTYNATCTIHCLISDTHMVSSEVTPSQGPITPFLYNKTCTTNCTVTPFTIVTATSWPLANQMLTTYKLNNNNLITTLDPLKYE